MIFLSLVRPVYQIKFRCMSKNAFMGTRKIFERCSIQVQKEIQKNGTQPYAIRVLKILPCVLTIPYEEEIL